MASLIRINDFSFPVISTNVTISKIRFIKTVPTLSSGNNDADESQIKPYHETPTKYRVSTMTILSDISKRVDLFLIYKHIPVFPFGDILNVRYSDSPPRGIFRLRKTKKSKKPKNQQMFLNQITLDVRLAENRLISVKLFKDGRTQLAGCRCVEEAYVALEKCIMAIRKCQNIEEAGEMIIRCNKIQALNLNRLLLSNKMTDEAWRNMLFDLKKIKFKNSQLEDNPLFTFPYIRKAIEDLQDTSKSSKLEIVMINSDFDAKVFIDKEKLVNVLKNVYGLHCRPISSRYPGINAKFLSNANCHNGCQTDAQKKKCADERKKLKGAKGCITVSILAFTQGKVIITGARSLAQLQETYDFVVKVFKQDYHNFGRFRPMTRAPIPS